MFKNNYYFETKSKADKMFHDRRYNTSFNLVFEKFVKSVDNMEETILVPTLLKDVPFCPTDVSHIPLIVAKSKCTKLIDIFCLMKQCRDDFIQLGFKDEAAQDFLFFQIEDNQEEVKSIHSHKVSFDSGNWSIDSLDKVLLDSPQPDSSTQPLLFPLLKSTFTNLKNIKVLFTDLKRVADFVTYRYLDSLSLLPL